MSPEQWSRIEEIFQRVAEHEPSSLRSRLLEEACAGDVDLRIEVEALLLSEEAAATGLQQAIDSEIDSLAFPLENLIISHFKILEGLEGGGMGVVYRARDLRLGRTVAIKFLPDDVLLEPEARSRFVREGQAASALEHPNICPIYEFGEQDGQLFLVMPLLEGQTLRASIAARLKQNQMIGLDELLDVAIQVLRGLEAAHNYGLIHRDIKPGNLFITTQGQIRILDFGLAKLVAATDALPGTLPPAQWQAVSPFDHTLSSAENRMGTAAYMSPEQSRGDALDARTDLFSFGITLFEMITGRRPTPEEASDPSTSALASRDPRTGTPLALILKKALATERERRYASAAEMRRDLERLKIPRETKYATAKRFIVMMTVLGLLAGGVGYLALTRARRTESVMPAFTLRQLTNNSPENHLLNGSISPDGTYLSFTDVKGLHLKHLPSGATRTVLMTGQTLDTYNNHPAWFPDSQSFLVNTHDFSTAFMERTPTDATIWRVYVDGSQPRRLRGHAFAWGVSPDGKQIVFGTHEGTGGPREAWLMGAEGDNARLLFASDDARYLGPFAWSPDGQRLAFVWGGQAGEFQYSLDLRGNSPVMTASGEELNAMPGRLLLPNRVALYALIDERIENTCNFWMGTYDPRTLKPVGAMHQLTNWSGFCMDPSSATQDGSKIGFLRWTNSRTIYLADLPRSSRQPLVSRHFTLDQANTSPVGWLPDGKSLVSWSVRDNHAGLFRQATEEDTAQWIADVPGDLQDPVLTGDGRWVIAWVSPAGARALGDPRMMRFPLQTGMPEWVGPVAPGGRIACAHGTFASCILAEPDPGQRHIALSFFDPLRGTRREITSFATDGDHVWDADIAPDGTRIAFLPGAGKPIGIYSLHNHRTSWIKLGALQLKQSLRWDQKGRGFYVTNGVKGGSELFHVNLQGVTQKLWHNDGTSPPVGFESPDGKHLAIQDSRLDVNMWLLEIAKKS